MVVGPKAGDEAATLCRDLLQALQHRGQQGAKITLYQPGKEGGQPFIKEVGGLGMVKEAIAPTNLAAIKCRVAVGEVRYSTHGENNYQNTPPLVALTKDGWAVVSHNGQFGSPRSIEEKRKEFLETGVFFHTTTDTSLLIAAFSQSKQATLEERLADAIQQLKGSGSILGVVNETVFVARKNGNRPLYQGFKGETMVFSSEDYKFQDLGVKGEEFPSNTLKTFNLRTGVEKVVSLEPRVEKECVFELIYFSMPGTKSKEKSMSQYREEFGAELAREDWLRGDYSVVPVPDSGNHAALGYAATAKMRVVQGIQRDHYSVRGFIGTNPAERKRTAAAKYTVDSVLVKGRKVVLVDDSLVRGTTLKDTVNKFREAGAEEVHVRIASPMIKHPCHYGIDMRTEEELIASNKDLKGIADFLGADSLLYLSLQGMYRAINKVRGRSVTESEFCDACFTGKYW